MFPEPANSRTSFPVLDAAADLGKYVKAVLLTPETSLGQEIYAAESYYTLEEVVETLKRLGVNVSLCVVDKTSFKTGLASKGLPEFFQEALLQLIQYVEEYGTFGDGNIGEGHKV